MSPFITENLALSFGAIYPGQEIGEWATYDTCITSVPFVVSETWAITSDCGTSWTDTSSLDLSSFQPPATPTPTAWIVRRVPANACLGNYTMTFTASVNSASSQKTLTTTVPSSTPNGGSLQSVELLGGHNESMCYLCGDQFTRNPVTASTGNFWHTFADLTVPGRGKFLDLQRTYNSSQASVDSAFGFGWSYSYGTSLTINPTTGDVTVNQENGSEVSFSNTGGTYTPTAPRVLATLVHNGDGTYTFTRKARDIFIFDSSGNLIAEKDLNGYTTTLTRPNGSTLVVTDPAGRTLTFTLSGGRITGVSDDAGARTMSFGYDGSGNLTDVTDVNGGTWSFTYDGNHRLLTMRDPNQAGVQNPPVVTNHYDGSGRVDWQKDQLNRQTSFDYTSIANSTKITDPKGNVVVDTFASGELISETRGYGTPQAATWTYAYDQNTAQTTATTNPRGYTSANYYDTAGNKTQAVDENGHTLSKAYDALNDVVTDTDAKKQDITYTYDAAGNVLTRSDPATTYTYGDPSHPGDITSVTDANGKIWNYSYDAAGNRTGQADPLGDTTQACFDADGRTTATISPRGTAASVTCATSAPAANTTYYTYNAFGQKLSQTDPLGHQQVWTYDKNQNTKSYKDADNNTTTYTYDAANEVTQVNRADTTPLKNDYWPDGTVKTQTDAANQATNYAYDPLGRLTGSTDPLNRTTSYGYDGANNRTSVVQPGNLTTTYGYDPANQVTSISYSDGTTPNVSMSYDANGQRTSMTDGTGTSNWAWDNLHRLTSYQNGAGQTIGYGYDPKGQVSTITYPGATGTITRGYDDAGRFTSVTDWANHQTTFGYDADSNLTSEAYPNSVNATFTVDDANRTMGISDTLGVSTLASFTYGRDDANQVTSVTSTGVPTDNHTYTYNALNQLKTIDTNTLTYDPADNPTTLANGTPQTFDAANEVTAAGTPNITLVGTTGGGNTGSPNPLPITLPSGTTTGDQVIVAATLPNNKSLTTPTGYTVVGTYTSGSSNSSAKMIVYRHTVAAGDSNSLSLSFSNSIAKAVTVSVYRGVDQSNPIDATPSNGLAAPGTSVTAPSITTTKAGNKLLVLQGATGASSSGTWTAPSGMTQRGQQAGGTGTAVAVADQTQASPGATGTRTATFSKSAQLVGVLLALKPAVPAYVYDGRGNRTSTTASNGATVAVGYDQANRLKTYGTAASYGYNGDGLRMSKTISGTTTQQTWDVENPQLPELIVDGTTNYVYGPSGLPVEQVNGAAVLYYHQDQLGSTRVLTDANGAVAATYTYDPFGKLAASTGTVTNPIGWAGQYTDAESGYQYLRARYYDSATAQFLTRDPVAASTRTVYAYASNSPLQFSDPTGLDFWDDSGLSDLWHSAEDYVSDHAEDLTTVAGVAGLLALAISTGGVGLPLLGISAEVLSTAMATGSFVAGALGAIGECAESVDARCVLSSAGVLAGGLSLFSSFPVILGSMSGTMSGDVAEGLRLLASAFSGFSSGLYAASLYSRCLTP